MKFPKLKKEDHALRRKLIRQSETPQAAFAFVVGKAIARERERKR